jgi:L-rhamnose-H+ transport protein
MGVGEYLVCVSVLALIALPVGAAVISIPSLQSVYREAGLVTIATIALCGAGWGLAQVLFGLSVDTIGVALAFSIVLGISAAVGSLLPLMRLKQFATSSAVTGDVLLGVALVLAGVIACAIAGRWREKAMGKDMVTRKSFGVALAMAICSGFARPL